MAGSSLIGALRVTLGLDSAAFTRGTKKAQSDMTAFQRKMSAIGTALKGAMAGIIGVELLTQFRDMSRQGLDYASSLGETAQQLGVTTDALQEYRYIASQVGIENDVMDKGLVKLTGKLGDLASGASGADKPFSRLNLSQTEMARLAGMNAQQALPMLADKFKALESDTVRVAAAQELFGEKMGGKFITLLAGGSATIGELQSAYAKLGIALSPAQIAAADEAADKIGALNQVVSAEQAKVAVDNAAGLLAYEKAVAKLKITLQVGVGNTFKFFDDLAEGYKVIEDTFKSLDNNKNQFNKNDDAFFPSIQKAAFNFGKDMREAYDGAKKRAFQFGKDIAKAGRDWVRYISNAVSDIKNWMGAKLDAAWDRAVAGIKKVTSWFDWMDNEVVRNSYVPDMVIAVNEWFTKMEKGMTGSTGRATQSVTEKMQAMRDGVASLLNELFPEAAAIRDVEAKIALLDNTFTAAEKKTSTYREAMRLLTVQLQDAKAAAAAVNQAPMMLDTSGMDDDLPDVSGTIDAALKDLPKLGGKTKMTFEDMARAAEVTAGTIANAIGSMQSSLSGFVSSLKKGDVAGILGGLANVIGSALSAFGKGGSLSGLFGSGSVKVPAFANGGAMKLGGFGGIDRNLLSLNGRPLAWTSAGETMQIHPNKPANNAGQMSVRVIEGDLFKVIVEGIAARTVAQSAPATAMAGSMHARSEAARRGRFRLS
jgi:hypothetical protein